jgi:tRNA A37 threonylcarbamoyladenosine synthetase subunit TsaC/SUA5/YrdC
MLHFQTQKPTFFASDLEIASLWDKAALEKAAGLILAEQTIALSMGSVCAMFGKGEGNSFLSKVVAVKGEKRRTQPLAILTNCVELVSWLDLTKIAPSLHPLFLNPAELAHRLGALCFLQLPVREEIAAILPPHLFSRNETDTPIVMALDPFGHPPLEHLTQLCHRLGLRFLAGTSLNLSGQPEIVEQPEAIDFCRRAGGISLFLAATASSPKARGSLSIISATASGLKLVRQGYLPLPVLEKLVGHPLDTTTTRPASYPQLLLEQELTNNLTPVELRQVILKLLA